MRILVSNCESAKHGAICRTYVQTTRHAVYGNLLHCACTICMQIIGYYVTTVTMMSSVGAKNACRVVPHGLTRSPQAPKQRKPGNPANYVAFKAGNKLKGNVNQVTRGKPMPFPAQKELKGNEPQRHHPPNPIKRRKTTCV